MTATIKAMTAEKLRNAGRCFDDDAVRAKVRQLLKEICRLLPDGTVEGCEFARLMFRFQVDGNKCADKILSCEEAKKIVEKTFDALLEMILNERNDMGEVGFTDYKNIRQKLVDAINKRK